MSEQNVTAIRPRLSRHLTQNHRGQSHGVEKVREPPMLLE